MAVVLSEHFLRVLELEGISEGLSSGVEFKAMDHAVWQRAVSGTTGKVYRI